MTFKVMWDSGHDQFTAGKGVAGMKEFEFNRAVVLEADKLIKEYQGVESRFSHDLYDGIDDSLTVRTNRANEWGADCFASVHANAASATSANGIETFVHLRAPRETVNLGAEVHGELIRATGMNNRGLKKADFAVLRQTKMDSFLAECGFMTNPGDLAKLKSDDFRKKCAQAIVNGIVKHYKLVKKPIITGIPYKVIIPNTAFWQARNLVIEFQQRGFTCYGSAVKSYGPGQQPAEGDPYQFIIETNLETAKYLVIELQTRGYDRTFGEALK